MDRTTLILTSSETQALYYVLHQLLSWPSLSPLCLYDDEEKALTTLYDKLSATSTNRLVSQSNHSTGGRDE